MAGTYKLDGHTPVKCDDLLEWARWFETAPRIVARTEIGGLLISTVFTGLDHNYFDAGPPILFETMVFGDIRGDNDFQTRCSTWAEAEEMHKRWVALAMPQIEGSL